MPSSAPAAITRGSFGCTARPKTDRPPWYPFHNLPLAQLIPPSGLRHRPIPRVPTQIVKFFAIDASCNGEWNIGRLNDGIMDPIFQSSTIPLVHTLSHLAF